MYPCVVSGGLEPVECPTAICVQRGNQPAHSCRAFQVPLVSKGLAIATAIRGRGNTTIPRPGTASKLPDLEAPPLAPTAHPSRRR